MSSEAKVSVLTISTLDGNPWELWRVTVPTNRASDVIKAIGTLTQVLSAAQPPLPKDYEADIVILPEFKDDKPTGGTYASYTRCDVSTANVETLADSVVSPPPSPYQRTPVLAEVISIELPQHVEAAPDIAAIA
ncbi:hypothetical protein EKI60_01345 [Candidatus Saccharibacteria bacterium]|nr:MAG: hypothetical protein EKI60_01345 [Candidatus Saccharibacteria bacterium]